MMRRHYDTFLRDGKNFRTLWIPMLAKGKMCCVRNISPYQKIFLVLFSLFLFTSSSIEYTDKRVYIPVFMDRSELEKSVTFVNEGRALKDLGKICVYGKYILVNERYKGIHVIDNTLPESPKNRAFITAPGCLDMAVKDGILYVDNGVDLVAFDLTRHKETCRIRNLLPPPSPPDKSHYYSFKAASESLILMGWERKTKEGV